MIKVERKVTWKAKKAMESLQHAKLKNSTYNTPEVNIALREMFQGKCYICENKQITSYQIEHLWIDSAEKDGGKSSKKDFEEGAVKV